jgi:transposase
MCQAKDIRGIFPMSGGGKAGMDEMGVLGGAKGILVHNYWKAYYGFEGKEHALCNAHLLRELRLAAEEGQGWAKKVIEYLEGLNGEVDKGGGKLENRMQEEVREAYQKLLREGDKECPKPEGKPPGKRGHGW